MRFTVSLALVASLIAPGARAGAQQLPSNRHDWTHVKKITAGTRVRIAVRGVSPGVPDLVLDKQYVVHGDDSGLVVLNLGTVRLPVQVMDALRDAAARHPEYFSAAAQGRSIRLPNQTLIERSGLFVSGRRVCELRDILNHITRDDVVSITVRQTRTRGSETEVARGAIAGFLVALVAGAGGGTGPSLCSEHPGGCWGVAGLGSIALAGASYLGGRGKVLIEDVVVYQAPQPGVP
jgi:hypothetical protein